MSDKHYVGLSVTSFENTGKHKPISRVTLFLDSENYYTAGDDTGKEIPASCPSATQEMADNLLAKLKGYEYQSFEAGAANIDPAAELGDGITVGGIYSVVSRMDDKGNGYSDVSSPGEAEVDDEYPFQSPFYQELNRVSTEIYSVITKTAEEISLEIVGLENAHSEMELTLDGLSTRIQDAEGNIGQLELTATELRSEISGKIGEDYAQTLIDQALDSITMEVSSASGSTTFKLLGGEVELDTTTLNLTVEAANISGTLKASQIELDLTGSISFTDLTSDVQNDINDAYSMAEDAQSEAATAYSLANSAYYNADSALNGLALLANGQYQGGTFIDGKNIYAPNLYGDTITLLDSYSRVVGTMSLQYGSTYAFDLSSKLSLRMQSAAGYNAYLGNGSTSNDTVAGVMCSSDGRTYIYGRLALTSYSYGYTLPTTGTNGQVFFLLEG